MLPIVLIEWLDAEDYDGTWASVEEAQEFADKECKAISVGFLIRKTSKYLTLGSDYDTSNDNYGTVRKIPVNMILSIKDLP